MESDPKPKHPVALVLAGLIFSNLSARPLKDQPSSMIQHGPDYLDARLAKMAIRSAEVFLETAAAE